MSGSEMIGAFCRGLRRVPAKCAFVMVTLLLATYGAGAQVAANPQAAEPDVPEIPSPSMLVLVHSWPDDLPVEMPAFTSDSLMVYEVRVDAAGALQKFHRVSGSDDLASYAEDFLLQVKFNSPVLEGKASGFKTTIGVCFSRELARKVAPCTVSRTGDTVEPAALLLEAGEAAKRVLHLEKLYLTATAKLAGKGGFANFHVLVGADGKVLDAKPISGPPAFIPVAEESIRKTTYRPLNFLGKPSRFFFSTSVAFPVDR